MGTTSKNLFGSTQCGEGIIDVLLSGEQDDGLDQQKGRITYRRAAEGIYGSMQSLITPREDGKLDGNLIEKITLSLYREMFEFISEIPGFQFVRIWNYVPLIVKNMDESAPDVEGYRCFNGGRYKAFQEQYGEDMQNWNIPAASAVGAPDNTLSIDFFASDGSSLFFENKVQIPAYQYSEKYGKLPPVFTRGAICELKDETLLLISGTASVVKEDTLFEDDLSGQIRQTFENINTLTNRSNLQLYGSNYDFGMEDLVLLRVYYKNHSDRELIESEIKKTVTTDCRISYVHTDICRDKLVIEIEGIYRQKRDLKHQC